MIINDKRFLLKILKELQMLRTSLMVGILALGVGHCGKKSGGGSQPILGKGTLQGVVRDALTGKRLDIRNSVFVLVGNQKLSSVSMPVSEQDGSLKGEYSIIGLPTDVAFPVITEVDGYELFEGIVLVNSSISQRTATSQTSDIELERPTVIGDILMIPNGSTSDDVEIEVKSAGDYAVSGADVIVKRIGFPETTLGEDGTSRPSENGYFGRNSARQTVITGKTSYDGRFVIKAAELALGASYSFKVIPPSLDQVPATGRFEVAIRSSDFGIELNNTEGKKPIKVKLAEKSSDPGSKN